ncbi:MAG: hypothetical protein K2X03_16240 [Bryobacteraceae bacterium]|nr:hypothetical protein [Bryobacteraceae bacterium]
MVTVACGLAVLSALAILFFAQRGELLWYGDATAHINIARRIFDSRTPGYEQIGTVWLPVPHLLMLPFVGVARWWSSGMAGAFAGSLCFVTAGCFLFATVRRLTPGAAPALMAVAVFALNPNLLYLQATPMSEAVLFAGLLALFWGLVHYAQTGHWLGLLVAAFAAAATTMTRYEGWFLLPFAAATVFWSQKRFAPFATFCLIAGAAPAYWLLHNWLFFGDPLEFYRGLYSAKGIYQTALDKGMARYPGDGDWLKAVEYFFAAARLNTNWVVIALGALGLAAALVKRLWWLFFLALTPLFYVISMHGSGTPIFLPDRWPHSYYNARYGLAALPLLAAGAAALVALLPRTAQWPAMFVFAFATLVPWLAYPRPQNWVCWKEAQVNSLDRRGWTYPAAEYLRQHYRRGDGILAGFGDQTGIFTAAEIPLKEVLHDGNGPAWFAAVARPDLFLHETWVVVREGDQAGATLQKLAGRKHPRYVLKQSIRVKGAPTIEIWRRVAMPIGLPSR